MNPDTAAVPFFGQDRKITPRHLDRLAVVYIRQSTLNQVQHHRESTRAQYDLADLAGRLGWPRDRTLIIDEDLGLSGASAEGRSGFQRLLSELALDHVGIILGIEMSRLARSCKDWYQLLELCALFGTLICDLDGLYDPAAYNDRLLLGLKGTMSEAELHILRQRMLQGAQQKARRGELFGSLPIGYVRDVQGQVQLDPDEQVRTAVSSIFGQFQRLGTVSGVLKHMRDAGMQIGVRPRSGPDRDQVSWRRPNQGTLRNMLTNPIYAGAYAYGRSNQRQGVGGKRSRRRLPAEQWQVLLRDRLPAYISWDQYQANLEQMRQNRSLGATQCAIRQGRALLAGLLVCGRCGYRMITRYQGRANLPRYCCTSAASVYGQRICQGLSAATLDDEVVRLALLALEPSALEVSLQVASDLQAQHDEAEKLWQQRLQRTQYEADRARRQYDAVEPENRLVARTLEAEWEQRLYAHRALIEQHERFCQEQPRLLSAEEQQQIRTLVGDLPALWSAPSTTDEDRKAILRQIIEKVVVGVEDDTQWVEARIHWAGGQKTYTRLRRRVSRIEQLSDFGSIRQTILDLRDSGLRSPQIADRLNEQGLRTTYGRPFTDQSVRTWISRYGPRCESRDSDALQALGPNEWLVGDLARKLDVNQQTVHGWIRRGRVHARRQRIGAAAWVVCVTESELRALMAYRQRQPCPEGETRPRHRYYRRIKPAVSGGAL